jgi:glycosyltransferase involved in cell wall biosynthesis
MRVVLLKSGDYAAWARDRPGTLPYRFDLLARRVELLHSDRHLRGLWVSPVVNRLVDAFERRVAPAAQTLLLLRRLRSADAVLAMFESEGHFLGALRWLHLPGLRRPAFVVVSCWLTELLATASERKRRWYRRLYSTVDRVFVLSSIQVEPTTEALGLPPGRVRFVHFGVDHDAFSPGDAVDGDHVLVAGRDRSRDWATVFDAARETSIPFKVLVRPRDLEGLVVPPNVEVLGYVPFDEYRELLLGARLVVVAVQARAYPTGQTVLLEAMAAGKAAVVTATPALADYLSGENARAVPVGNAPALREAIEELYEDAEARAAIGVAGRRFVEETANAARMWGRIADELEPLRR